MDRKTFPFNATIFTGLGIMALSRLVGFSSEMFAVGCGMMLLSASVACLSQSKLANGFRSHVIFSLGVFGLISLPLVIAAISVECNYAINATLIGILFTSAIAAATSMTFWSVVNKIRLAKSQPIAS